MTTDSVIDDVLLLLGEDPELCLHSSGSGACGLTLRERIGRELAPCASRAVADTPRMQLTGWRRLGSDGLSVDADGRALLPLPADYLSLFSLRMTSWSHPVAEVLGADSWLRRLQGNRWHGLRGSPQRPLVFATVADDGSPALELFSCPPEDTLAEGWYMPAPVPADGVIEIPPAAYRRCLGYIVETLRM